MAGSQRRRPERPGPGTARTRRPVQPGNAALDYGCGRCPPIRPLADGIVSARVCGSGSPGSTPKWSQTVGHRLGQSRTSPLAMLKVSFAAPSACRCPCDCAREQAGVRGFSRDGNAAGVSTGFAPRPADGGIHANRRDQVHRATKSMAEYDLWPPDRIPPAAISGPRLQMIFLVPVEILVVMARPAFFGGCFHRLNVDAVGLRPLQQMHMG